jgi:hypothetical protein
VWRIPGVDDSPPAPKVKLPPFVVSTSADGRRKILFRAETKRRLTGWLLRHVLFKLAPNGITITRARHTHDA